MRKLLSALLVCALAAPASAQFSGPPYNPANVAITGGTVGGTTTIATSGTINTTGTAGGNGITLTPSGNGGTPTITAVGANSNISLSIAAKGSAGVTVASPTAFTSAAGVTFSGNVAVAGQLGSANNTNLPSPTNSGITIGGAPTWAMQSFYDQANAANNRSADLLFISNSIKFRFANDARNAFLDVLSINGGQALGVTGITSTSGTGIWAHTGGMSANNLRLPSVTVSALPTCDTNAKGTIYSVSDATTPAYNATLAGGGAVAVLAFCNGTNWTAH